MKFFHIADVHLGAVPDKGYPWSDRREQEIWLTFRQILEKAKQQEADLVLIAGDLFHQEPSLRQLREVDYLFGKLQDIQVVWIAGNHDYIREGSILNDFSWSDNVTFLKNHRCECVYFEEWDTYVYGFSYHQREITQPLYDDLYPNGETGCHILLAHGGDEKHIPIQTARLEKNGFDYVALGHIHKPWILVKDHMAYAGATEPLDRNDTGPHGYIVGEYRDGKMHIEFVEAAVREYVHLNIACDERSTELSLQEQLEREIQEQGEENIYDVCLTGYRDPALNLRPKNWMCHGNILAITDHTRPDYDLQELYEMHKDDIVGRYLQRLLGEEPAGSRQHDEQAGRDNSQRLIRAAYMGVHALLGRSQS